MSSINFPVSARKDIFATTPHDVLFTISSFLSKPTKLFLNHTQVECVRENKVHSKLTKIFFNDPNQTQGVLPYGHLLRHF